MKAQALARFAWGGLGLLIVGAELFRTLQLSNVGVGQSAYVTMLAAVWTVGMVLFGIGRPDGQGRTTR